MSLRDIFDVAADARMAGRPYDVILEEAGGARVWFDVLYPRPRLPGFNAKILIGVGDRVDGCFFLFDGRQPLGRGYSPWNGHALAAVTIHGVVVAVMRSLAEQVNAVARQSRASRQERQSERIRHG